MIKGPKRLVKRAEFFARILGITEDFDLTIKWWNNPEFSGECEKIAENKYVIRLTKGERYWNYRSLAHEMTHLKQYVKKELFLVYVDGMGFYMYNGKLIRHTGDLDEYYLYPWEQEARHMEAYLLYKWDSK